MSMTNSILHCGIGAVAISRGTYEGRPALFLVPAKFPGQPGAPSDREDIPADALIEHEVVLTFPTEDQVLQVRDLICFTGFAAMAEVARERHRQLSDEDFRLDEDDAYVDGSLAKAGVCYASEPDARFHWEGEPAPRLWPWPPEWWKPTTRRRDLVKAAALLIAEIERLDRAAARETETGPGGA